MNKRNLVILSIAFMLLTSIALMMNGNANSNTIEDQMAYETYETAFDGKCGDGKTTKEVKAKKEEKKGKCGDGKCGDGKTELDTKASKTSNEPNTKKEAKVSPAKKDGKCGDGKTTKEDKTKSAKKEKCGSGKCGDGK